MKHFTFRLFLIRKLIEWARARKTVSEQAEACRRIIAAGTCEGAEVLCETSNAPEGWVKCPNCGKEPSEAWRCSRSADSARRWLAEHGIKE